MATDGSGRPIIELCAQITATNDGTSCNFEGEKVTFFVDNIKFSKITIDSDHFFSGGCFNFKISSSLSLPEICSFSGPDTLVSLHKFY